MKKGLHIRHEGTGDDQDEAERNGTEEDDAEALRICNLERCRGGCNNIILLVAPGILSTLNPTDRAVRNRGRDDCGRPAAIAASATYFGMFFFSSLLSMDTYRDCAMAPPSARREPRTPVVRPKSCGSIRSVTPGKEILSM